MPKNCAATWLLVTMVSSWIGFAAAEPPEPEPKVAPSPIANPQQAEYPAEQEDKGEALVGRGVVVESVGKGSALENAGLRPGDVLYRWRRLPNPPANPHEAAGEFASPFDWWDVKSEQVPRSAIDLFGWRETGPRKWSILLGEWPAEVRPNWPEEITKLYLLGLERIEAGEIGDGVQVWQELAEQQGDGKFNLCYYLWLKLRISEAWAKAKKWENITPFLREFESAPSLDRVQAYALQRLGVLALRSGDLSRGVDYLQRARAFQAADSLSLAATLNNLGIIFHYSGDLARAADLLERAVQIEERHAPNSLKLAASLNNLAVVERQRGDLPRAEGYLRRTLQIEERLAPKSLAVAATLNNLGSVELFRGDLVSAAEYFTRSLAIHEEHGPRGLEVAASLEAIPKPQFVVL